MDRSATLVRSRIACVVWFTPLRLRRERFLSLACQSNKGKHHEQKHQGLQGARL